MGQEMDSEGEGCFYGLRFYLEKFIFRPKSTTNFYNNLGERVGKISSFEIGILGNLHPELTTLVLS